MAAQSSTSSPQDGSGGGEFSDNLVLQTPQPMREDYIQNAVNFLGHPKVKSSPVFYRRSFLEKKGLTKEEIDEAFRRVPDPQPNSTDVAAVASQQAGIANQSAGVQPYETVQAPQAINTGPIVPHAQPQLSWSRTLIGVGVFLGVGASAAVILKKLFVPRLKSWIQGAHVEGDEISGNELKSKFYEEIKAAIQDSASAFSDIAKTNQELLASKDEDKKILTKLAQAFDSQAEAFRSLSDSLNRMSENRFYQYNLMEDHFQSAPWNGPTTNSWRASQQTNAYNTSPRSDFDSGRHPFMPVPGEPSPGAFPARSYVEQRMQRPGYGFQPQMSNDRWNPGSPLTNYHGAPPYQQYHHGSTNAIDEALAPAPVPAPAPPAESPFQRRWVPPQPPGVVMPEAVAAIRQPRQQVAAASRPSESAAATEQPQSGDVAGGAAMANAGNGEAEQEREAAA
ncbi:peroxisomal membrane protein PEX14-like isoform X2 [Oryza glaberrima]|uniref:peroxisomal membrane protein PEX14-like isoform X2 n=1 Tax=Oryza glaberrima TaxID=4538 RepID=UPI00224C2443|nr:peroxisomal membrane protein PEX14-like isoform X2 [Oryza glaberrima]